METTDFKEESSSQIFAQFQRPQSIGDPVIVNRYLPDSTTELIGTIDSYFDNDDNLVFTCMDRNGKTLFSPTDDYSLAEGRFELYAKQLTVKAIRRDKGNISLGFKERINELKELRIKNQKDNEREIEK